ncbi:hypothetical protein EV193_11949 [Herbihabitans rhizosphaerae]|uniref:Alpha/beta hydrolase n=1 Tax=Herbihabitans rhizosphaerae TaxID=1872711 RepID=A0A4Q7KB18_9PSEU|nr:hypothetical protein [Herbihabitans rhizosphaerae]RZS29646.1 hypothetical protein EV193_11949 [Herbihabitans rhizosphaerae]
MLRRAVVVVMVAVATVLGLLVVPAGATPPDRPTGPVDLVGELGGVPYEIRVPANWNRTLVMYAHGYEDAADHPGEPGRRPPNSHISEAHEQAMLNAGYAIAGSAYASAGWAVRDGIRDTRALAKHFGKVVGKPRVTLLGGYSMGSIITFESIERYAETYDGAMPSCPVGAGSTRTWDGVAAVASAYAAVYGWPAAWGRPGDVRDDLDFESEVAPILQAQLAAPDGRGKFEFMRLAAGVPTGPEWPLGIWSFATEGRAELERRAGGPITQNLDHTYRLSTSDRQYLAGLGVGGDQVDGYLSTMDKKRLGAHPKARHYLERYADYSGRIRNPVLTLHTTVDALVPQAHISAYNQTVADAGRERNAANAWTSGVGHCRFTPTQVVTATKALESWVRTGQRPGRLPAEQGFVAYDPPPWPQP